MSERLWDRLNSFVKRLILKEFREFSNCLTFLYLSLSVPFKKEQSLVFHSKQLLWQLLWNHIELYQITFKEKLILITSNNISENIFSQINHIIEHQIFSFSCKLKDKYSNTILWKLRRTEGNAQPYAINIISYILTWDGNKL